MWHFVLQYLENKLKQKSFWNHFCEMNWVPPVLAVTAHAPIQLSCKYYNSVSAYVLTNRNKKLQTLIQRVPEMQKDSARKNENHKCIPWITRNVPQAISSEFTGVGEDTVLLKRRALIIKKDFRNRKAKQADSIQESEETQQWQHRNESCIRGLENNEICIAGSSVGYKKIKSRDFNLSVFRNHLSIWIFKHSLDNFDLQLRLRAT